jgi:hypothetical protein
MAADWAMKGYLLGACSCDWGCPCSFNAAPTQGFCEGGYVWHTSQGHYEKLRLDGLNLAWIAHSPAALHLGNVISQVIVDAKATPEQREALLKLAHGSEGGPWTIFAAVTSKWLEPLAADFDVNIDGLHSHARAGKFLDLTLSPIVNPVTGHAEELQLRKPTGFTSTWADLGKTERLKITCPSLKYDHSGKYGEYSEFAYAPEEARETAAGV